MATKQERDKLPDWYVKDKLLQEGFSKETINLLPELINIKRKFMIKNREIKAELLNKLKEFEIKK